jgi:hypothetical protein
MLEIPDADALAAVNDADPGDFPDLYPARRRRDQPEIDEAEIPDRVSAALDALPLGGLPDGAEVGLTAGSRGIHPAPAVLAAAVADLDARGFEPFVLAAMGSHGGATAEGQRETLAALGITEARLGCEIRSSMDTERVGTDGDDRPVYVAADALAADAVVLVNRVKAHTDFEGAIESGLCKMAVIGLGKQRGAESAHSAALASSFREVLPERAALLFEETPIVGGLAVVENASEHLAELHGLGADEIVEREPAILERADELMPMLPVEDLDLLILDEIGKDVSGAGMDNNVVGRMRLRGEPDLETPDIARIHVRSITEASHGNATGLGIADFAHERAVEGIDLETTYLNCITGGGPEPAAIPVVVPEDRIALAFAYSTTGVRDPGDMHIAHIQNTLEPDDLLVSEPVAAELREHPAVEVGEGRPLTFDDGDFAVDRPWVTEPAAADD